MIKFYRLKDPHGYMGNFYKARHFVFGKWWRAIPDSDKVERLDLIHTPWKPDEEAKNIILAFREIEKEFPPIREDK